MQKFVQFLLDGKIFGMDIRNVQEILQADELRTFKVPNSPDYLQGVLNLRGVLTPVVDLRIKMGLAPAGISDRSRVIICKTGRQDSMGVLVDQFAGIVAPDDPDVAKGSGGVAAAAPMEIIDLSQVFSGPAMAWRAPAL